MNETFRKAFKARFGIRFGHSLKTGFIWKLKPLSAEGYASHSLVLQNEPPTKLSRSIWYT